MITDEILELVKSRSSPGVLVLDRDRKLLYANEEALNFLNNSQEIPPEVRQVCEELKEQGMDNGSGPASGDHCGLLWREGESPCSIRAFLIGAQAKGRPATHIMVLIEKVTEQHGLNLKKAKVQYGLSDREIEVVALVGQGLANKDIGSRLFISEHTTKDHIKNIMRKTGTASRSELIYVLK